MNQPEMTHLNQDGEVHMVEVGEKETTRRVAVAEALVRMPNDLVETFFQGELAKGDAGAAARVAGIMAAKRTSELIPLCHPIPLTGIEIDVSPGGHGIRIAATVSTTGQTGVEMEALTAVSVSALTIYDMVKSVERGVTIESIRLLEKSGGRSGSWKRPEVVDS